VNENYFISAPKSSNRPDIRHILTRSTRKEQHLEFAAQFVRTTQNEKVAILSTSQSRELKHQETKMILVFSVTWCLCVSIPGRP